MEQEDNMKTYHLKLLDEISWNNYETFVSASDGSGNWIFGDGTYALRMHGTPFSNEGDERILSAMIRHLDRMAEDKNKKPITLPSIGYLKKKNKANSYRYRIATKFPGTEIFVNSMILYPMLKILSGATAYMVETEGYHPYSHEKVKAKAVYLVSDKGEGVLIEMTVPRRA